jgi:hypothetical protein
VNRVQYRIAQARRLLADRAVQVGLAVFGLGGALSVLILIYYPTAAPSTILSVISSATASFTGAYVSYAVIARHLLGTERDRIDPPEKVCDRYAKSIPLLRTTQLEPSESDSTSRSLPCVVTDDADPDAVLSAEVRIQSDPYAFPPSVDSVLEPRMEVLRDRFETEGKFNARKARLESVDDGCLTVSETSYFRSFCTNFAPDMDGPNGGPTLRESFENEFVTDGDVVPLGDSPFSDHLGGGGIAVTTEGKALLGVRAPDVTVGERKVGHAFGGNFEFRNLLDGCSVCDELRREATEELTGLDAGDVVSLTGLGLVRRVDWLGKPDVHCLALIDGEQSYSQASTEFYGGVTVDLGVGELTDASDLTDPATADRCVRRIREEIEKTSFTPSVNYYISLELWLRNARNGDTRGAQRPGERTRDTAS